VSDKKPPNFRFADSCESCKQYVWDNVFECTKHETMVVPSQVCDDYEPRPEEVKP
jgi:hypothetical protein